MLVSLPGRFGGSQLTRGTALPPPPSPSPTLCGFAAISAHPSPSARLTARSAFGRQPTKTLLLPPSPWKSVALSAIQDGRRVRGGAPAVPAPRFRRRFCTRFGPQQVAVGRRRGAPPRKKGRRRAGGRWGGLRSASGDCCRCGAAAAAEVCSAPRRDEVGGKPAATPRP